MAEAIEMLHSSPHACSSAVILQKRDVQIVEVHLTAEGEFRP